MENQSFESFYRSTRDDCFRALIVAVGMLVMASAAPWPPGPPTPTASGAPAAA